MHRPARSAPGPELASASARDGAAHWARPGLRARGQSRGRSGPARKVNQLSSSGKRANAYPPGSETAFPASGPPTQRSGHLEKATERQRGWEGQAEWTPSDGGPCFGGRGWRSSRRATAEIACAVASLTSPAPALTLARRLPDVVLACTSAPAGPPRTPHTHRCRQAPRESAAPRTSRGPGTSLGIPSEWRRLVQVQAKTLREPSVRARA